MIPPERDLSTKWYYQCIQSRYGFNPHHLMLADACEFFIGQGCKVGLGDPPELQKFVCGKVLYNYDNLEPAERKLVL